MEIYGNEKKNEDFWWTCCRSLKHFIADEEEENMHDDVRWYSLGYDGDNEEVTTRRRYYLW